MSRPFFEAQFCQLCQHVEDFSLIVLMQTVACCTKGKAQTVASVRVHDDEGSVQMPPRQTVEDLVGVTDHNIEVRKLSPELLEEDFGSAHHSMFAVGDQGPLWSLVLGGKHALSVQVNDIAKLRHDWPVTAPFLSQSCDADRWSVGG